MAQPRHEVADHSPVAQQPADTAEWDAESLLRVDLTADLRAAVTRAATAEERLVVLDEDQKIAAIIPIEDFQLFLRLEEEELGRIDLAEVRKGREDPDNQDLIPWETIKAKYGL